jgi:hypothetical protein
MRILILEKEMKHEQGYTDGGRNPYYEGIFDGETEGDKERRIKWAMNEDQLPWPGMMTAFENYYGQSWFDKSSRDETAIWAAACKAAKTHNATSNPRSVAESG